MSRVHFLVALVTSCALLGPNGERALGVIFWNVTTSGTFNTPSNWSPNIVPGSGDVAFFNVNATYTVTFQNDVTNSLCEVDNGTVTFALGGATYTTTSTGTGDLIGSTAGQTGRLTVTNGIVNGDFSIGSAVGATGILTVSSDAIWNFGAQNIAIGNDGTGTLAVSGGGHFTGVANAFVGESSTGNGTITVSGTGSTFVSHNVTIGDAGIGDATISSGATATTTTIAIANQAGSTGSLTVTGASSSLDTGLGNITVGVSGAGVLTVSGGGTLNSSGTATLAAASGSFGDVTITGAGSTWNVGNNITVGNSGNGTLTITGGGTLNTNGLSNIIIGSGATSNSAVTLTGNGSAWNAKLQGIIVGSSGAGSLTVGSGATLTASAITLTASTGTMTMNGGTVDVGGAFTRNGLFNFNDGTLIARGQFANFSSLQPLTIDGNTSSALPTLELIGNSTTTNVTTLTVGNARQGALVIKDGRNVGLGNNSIAIGALAGSSGSITLDGQGAQLSTSTSGTTSVGGGSGSAGGTGVLTLNTSGAGLSTGVLILYPGGTVILNGGALNISTFSANGGTVQFNSGTINFTGATPILASDILDAILGGGHFVGFGRILSSSTSLSTGSPLAISGGTVSATTTFTSGAALNVTDGTLSAGTTLTNSSGQVLRISGTGVIKATSGITNNGTIQLENNLTPTAGGTLTNGGTIRGTGYVGNNLTNNSGGQVQLTAGNRLEFQGTTNTNNGLLSLTGGELVFTGPLTNSASTGLISGRDAILRTGGSGITNNGSLAFTAGTMDVYGDITNNSTGLITCSGGGTTTFYDDVTIANGASSVRASAVGGVTSKVVFFGSYNGGIVGGGTAFIEGDHRPGNSPGVVAFGGDLAYGGLASLHVEIGGTTPGTGAGHHDQVNVAGQAALGGTLDLVPFGGFVPVAGDKFVVMTYASASGTFATVTGTTPAPGLTYTPVYSPTNLTILTTTTGEKTWAVDSSGNASVGANWTGGVAPGGVGDSAAFTTIITAPRVVTLDADTTVGALKFDSPNNYTIAGPHTLTLQAAGATSATITVLNTHGNGAHTISAPIALASNLNILQNAGATLKLSGPLNDSTSRAITKSGSGTVETTGPPTLGNGTVLAVTAGTLRFALISGSPSIGGGVQAIVSGTATLELAGSISAISSAANRVSITNNSAATAGLLVSGTNQVVGTIDGSGSTQVNTGGDLTANHIIQSALAIGGTAGNLGLVTIAASDASGNPLAKAAMSETTNSSGLLLAGDPVSFAPIGVGRADVMNVAGGSGASSASSGNAFAAASASPGGSALTVVPEPSTLLLSLLSLAALVPCAWRRNQSLSAD